MLEEQRKVSIFSFDKFQLPPGDFDKFQLPPGDSMLTIRDL